MMTAARGYAMALYPAVMEIDLMVCIKEMIRK
jgi:hypothetical protein